LERDREFAGQGVLHLHASSDQTDMDVIVKVSLLPVGADKPPTIRVTQGWLRVASRRRPGIDRRHASVCAPRP
jgi:predicted acyl esterase